MTNEQAIRCAIADARTWTRGKVTTAIGIGCRMQAKDVLHILGQCPAGKAALRKARNRPKSSRGMAQESRGRKTRSNGQVARKIPVQRTSAPKQAVDQK